MKKLLLLITLTATLLIGCGQPKSGTVVGRAIQKEWEFTPNAELNPFDKVKIPAVYYLFIETPDGKRHPVAVEKEKWDAIKDGDNWNG